MNTKEIIKTVMGGGQVNVKTEGGLGLPITLKNLDTYESSGQTPDVRVDISGYGEASDLRDTAGLLLKLADALEPPEGKVEGDKEREAAISLLKGKSSQFVTGGLRSYICVKGYTDEHTIVTVNSQVMDRDSLMSASRLFKQLAKQLKKGQ